MTSSTHLHSLASFNGFRGEVRGKGHLILQRLARGSVLRQPPSGQHRLAGPTAAGQALRSAAWSAFTSRTKPHSIRHDSACVPVAHLPELCRPSTVHLERVGLPCRRHQSVVVRRGADESLESGRARLLTRLPDRPRAAPSRRQPGRGPRRPHRGADPAQPRPLVGELPLAGVPTGHRGHRPMGSRRSQPSSRRPSMSRSVSTESTADPTPCAPSPREDCPSRARRS